VGSSGRGVRVADAPEDPYVGVGVVSKRAKWGEGAEMALVGKRLRR
jgi:hypothetical protein